MAGVIGCGTGTQARPVVGAIAATDPQGVVAGQLSTATLNSKTSLSVTVADDQKLGVDWSVTCNGNPVTGVIAGSCGSISPSHTANGVVTTYTAPSIVPLDNTVIITAAATVDPTRTANLTLTIKPLPITIAFANGSGPVLPPASLTLGSSTPLFATVSNDPTAAGVNWTLTCGSASCGSFNQPNAVPNQTASGQAGFFYTAPSTVPVGGTVTVTATAVADSTKSKTAIISIVPVTVSVLPTTLSVATAGSANVVATATDPANLGIDWTVSCTGTLPCGTITTHTASGVAAIYRAPSVVPAGPVTLTAKATASGAASATATVTVLPIGITIIPAALTLGLTEKANFVATVTNDGAAKGVTWTLTCSTAGSCGTIVATGNSVAYTAPSTLPAGNAATLTATSITDSTRTAVVPITLSATPVLAVAITQAPTTPVALNKTVSLIATVSNDSTIPAQQGVDWSLTCGAAAGSCGTLTPSHTASGVATTYTAPAAIPVGSSVIVTATSTADNTKLAAVTLTIYAPVSIAFGQVPTSPISTGATENITAVVTNDVATAGGVDWSCSPVGTCGRFVPAHTASGATTVYTAPALASSGTAVTLTATATADPTQFVSQAVTVNPVAAVSFYPLAPSRVTAASTVPVNLTAVVANDGTHSGVDWSVCSDLTNCGQFLVTPAAPVTPSNPLGTQAVYGSSVHTASGVAAIYVPPLQVPSSGQVVITATSHAIPTAKATTTVAVSTASTGVALNGFVLSGVTPIAGSRVALYAAGTSGYASASSLLSPGSGYVTTDATGAFSIPATYTCPAQTSLLYLVATGGNAGPGANPNLVLMTALGQCNGLSSSAPIYITEATTVASVWALAPFMSGSANVGSSSANATTGLATAFGTVNNLVNIHTGEVLGTTVVGNGIVPQAEINTLASLLATCVDSTGGQAGDGSPCSALFLDTNVSTNVSTAATDTLQAALDVALNPANQKTNRTTAQLFALLPASPVYQPVLAGVPNDFTIAINFAGGGLEVSGTSQNQPASRAMAIDASGNVWVANSRIPSVTELSNLGAPLSPWTTGSTRASAGGFRDSSLNSPGSIAVDLLGNVWIGNANGSLTELSYAGTDLSGTGGFTGGGLANGRGIAIDSGDSVTSPGGNIWVVGTGAQGVAKFNGSTGAPFAGSPFTAGGIIGGTSGAIAIDGAGTVWVGDNGNQIMVELNSLTGAFIQTDNGSITTGSSQQPSQLLSGIAGHIAIDGTGASGTGNVWVPSDPNSGVNSVSELLSTGQGGSIFSPPQLSSQGPIAIDGNGRVWLSSGGNSVGPPVVPPNILELSNSGSLISVIPNAGGYTATGITEAPTDLAIDNAGNVWILSGGAFSTVTEFIGAAAPVTTPTALAAQKGKLGKRP